MSQLWIHSCEQIERQLVDCCWCKTALSENAFHNGLCLAKNGSVRRYVLYRIIYTKYVVFANHNYCYINIRSQGTVPYEQTLESS